MSISESTGARVRISEMRHGDHIEGVYLLQDFQIRPRKDGGSYLTMVLCDASGKITGIMWDNFAPLRNGAIQANDYIRVSADVQTHQNQLQLRVTKAEKVPDELVKPEDFLPVTPYNIEELEQAFWGLVHEIQDSDLEKLVRAIFEKPRFWNMFRRAPSAVSMHQAYLGGLLEHTVMVTKNALKLADNYPDADRSLLIAGALLHDIGKTLEFTYDKKIAYTDIGRLIGHIPMGYAMIEYEAARLGTPPVNKKVLVQHIVLSHHGLLEYGSPKQPQTLEALIVHHADQLDAQLSNYLEAAQNTQSAAKWEYRPMFERHMYAGSYDELEVVELLRALGYTIRPPSHKTSAAQTKNQEDLLNEIFPANQD
ncbi:MAG: HD domain-containing protein [Candidatus Sumerlaeaceae bacterium]|nr:HD domain-containing protein [Candidatus Sumerlaeaceae bacterium]